MEVHVYMQTTLCLQTGALFVRVLIRFMLVPWRTPRDCIGRKEASTEDKPKQKREKEFAWMDSDDDELSSRRKLT